MDMKGADVWQTKRGEAGRRVLDGGVDSSAGY